MVEVKSGFSKMIKSINAGLFVGAIVMALCLVVSAIIVSKMDIPFSAIPMFSTGTIILGALSSGFTSAKVNRSKGILMGLASGIILSVVTLVAVAFVTADFELPHLAVKFAVFVISSAIGGVMGVNQR